MVHATFMFRSLKVADKVTAETTEGLFRKATELVGDKLEPLFRNAATAEGSAKILKDLLSAEMKRQSPLITPMSFRFDVKGCVSSVKSTGESSEELSERIIPSYAEFDPGSRQEDN